MLLGSGFGRSFRTERMVNGCKPYENITAKQENLFGMGFETAFPSAGAHYFSARFHGVCPGSAGAKVKLIKNIPIISGPRGVLY